MKKTILWLLKAAIGGLVAFVGLTAFCSIYYNVPVHTQTVDGATDYAWEYNKFYSRATEGFGYGRTNNEGYLNIEDYSGSEEIDILVMGSSHMEAYQVSMEESTASRLNALLPDDTVYNIGVSGHDFLVCADNLSAAVAKYRPSKYVLLETSNISFSEEQLTAAINETVSDIPSHSGGIFGILQKNQFLRRFYSQIQSFSNNTKATGKSEKAPSGEVERNLELYDELLSKMSGTVAENGAQLIIVYQYNLEVEENGAATYSKNDELVSDFAAVCERNNVMFLDMGDYFVKYYEENLILPHGFWNTSVGSGHLNQYGHEIIAHAVYDMIKEGT